AGCTGTSTLVVTVNALPVVTTTASNSTICAGSNTTLTASGASTYTWNPGNLSGASVTVSPTATTTYTVTGTSVAGCTETSVVLITVNALPVVTATAGNSTICAGDTTTLNASGADTYIWNPGNLSGATVTVSPLATTTYAVSATDVNGCINQASVTINVNPLPLLTAIVSPVDVCMGDTAVLSVSGAFTYNWMPGSLNGAVVSVVPGSSTTYSVTGTDVNGCTNTSTVAVNVNPLPVVSITSAVQAICVGETATLTASGALNYSWLPVNQSGNSVTVSPAASTTYSVTGTDVNGCTGSDVFLLDVNPLPVVQFVAGVDTLCLSSSPVILTGATPAGGLYSGNGVSGGSFDPAAAGVGLQTITYTYTDANGCVNSDSDYVWVDVCTSDPGLEGALQITVQPNPSEGQFTVLISGLNAQNYILECYNSLGQLVLAEQIAAESDLYRKDFDISEFGRGYYLLRLTSKTSSKTVRVITN
ncbi:MAG: T9SS type A sorting domain-containing protein, partial [Chitinophagaceae bacterium]|nr:T9SS type A sorting domain-containing protein [Chitinophagaceae bacterium]